MESALCCSKYSSPILASVRCFCSSATLSCRSAIRSRPSGLNTPDVVDRVEPDFEPDLLLGFLLLEREAEPKGLDCVLPDRNWRSEDGDLGLELKLSLKLGGTWFVSFLAIDEGARIEGFSALLILALTS